MLKANAGCDRGRYPDCSGCSSSSANNNALKTSQPDTAGREGSHTGEVA